MKKVGSIVRADNSGLGNLAWDFYRHGLIDKVLIQPENKGAFFPERYGEQKIVDHVRLSQQDVNWILDGIDVLLCFETAYNENIIAVAKERDIKTILMPMHEGGAGWKNQKPDVWLCPSDMEYDIETVSSINKIRINVPVDTKKLPQKVRTKARHFVHNAGHGGMIFRNGTPELIQALEFTDSDFKLTIRTQTIPFDVIDPRVEYEYANYENYWDLWEDGDVLIMPDKFAGLSMPIQEAFASGFMVMTTNRYPLNEWLPTEPLFDSQPNKSNYCGTVIDLPEPKNIAAAIDKWYNQDITKYSQAGLDWARENSWEKLLPEYEKIIRG